MQTDSTKPEGQVLGELGLERALTCKERIEILMEEYKTLRTELLERHTVFMQLCALAATGLIATFGYAVANNVILAGVVTGSALICAIVVGLLLLDNDSRLLSARIQEIEADINKRSADKLLVWESTRGLPNLGYLSRLKQTARRLFNLKSFRE